jgi:hypothetical protein
MEGRRDQRMGARSHSNPNPVRGEWLAVSGGRWRGRSIPWIVKGGPDRSAGGVRGALDRGRAPAGASTAYDDSMVRMEALWLFPPLA